MLESIRRLFRRLIGRATPAPVEAHTTTSIVEAPPLQETGAPSFTEAFLATADEPTSVATALALLAAAEQNYGAWHVGDIETFFRDLRGVLTRLAERPGVA